MFGTVTGVNGWRWRAVASVAVLVATGLPGVPIASVVAEHRAPSSSGPDVVTIDLSGPVPEVIVTEAGDPLPVDTGDPMVVSEPERTFVPFAPVGSPAAPDPLADRLYHLDVVRAPDVWADGVDGTGVTIAVLDTGVWGIDVTVDASIDFTGVTDALLSHGNNVASAAASALDDGVGGAGVAPGAHVLSAKVCSPLSCDLSDVARAVLWAVDHGADVINMSLGGGGSSPVLDAAIGWAVEQGVTVVAAAGNSSCSAEYDDNCNPDYDNVNFPAANRDVIAVTATDATDVSPYWTSKGRRSIVAAPGDDLWFSAGGLYGTMGSGTSFSSPVVAGIVALTVEAEPALLPEQRQLAVMLGARTPTAATIRPLPREWYYGAGVADAVGAVEWSHRLADADAAGGSTLSAVSTATGFDLSWDAVPGATYEVITMPAPAYPITTAATTHTLTGLEPGRTYAIAVVAHTSLGEQFVGSALAEPGPTPAAPIVTSASVASATGAVSVTVSNQPATPVVLSATLDGRPIGRSTPYNGTAWFTVDRPTPNGAVLEVAYELVAGGRGPTTTRTLTSNPSMFVPPVGRIRSSSSGGVSTLSWDPVPSSGGGDTITYRVTANGWSYALGDWDRHDVTTSSPSLTLPLRLGVSYSVGVSAISSSRGWSAATSSSFLPLPDKPPPPELLSAGWDPAYLRLRVVPPSGVTPDVYVVTSTSQFPFAATATDNGDGTATVLVARHALALYTPTSTPRRVCLASDVYLDAGGSQRMGDYSNGLSFNPDVPAVTDHGPCGTIGAPLDVVVPPTTDPPTTTPPTTSPPPTTDPPTTTVPEPPRFEPITPTRFADTRESTRITAGGVLRVDVSERGDSSAVVINLTAVGAARAGFLTAWSCRGVRPGVSTVNYTAGSVDANAAFVEVDDGSLCVYSSQAVDVVVDVTGVFHGESASFTPLTPARLLDTRSTDQRLDARSTIEVQVAGRGEVPDGAHAVTINLTAVAPGNGFLTVWPCDEARPFTSNLNTATGDTRPNAATVKLSADGRLCVFSSSATDVVVDVNGWWGDDGAHRYEAVEPTRVLDTRDPGLASMAAGETRRVFVADAAAAAVNITVVNPERGGFVTAWPCGPMPLASSANFTAGMVRPNAAAVALAPSGELCLFASAATDVVVDLAGVWR